MRRGNGYMHFVLEVLQKNNLGSFVKRSYELTIISRSVVMLRAKWRLMSEGTATVPSVASDDGCAIMTMLSLYK